MAGTRLHIFGVGPQEQWHARPARQHQCLPLELKLPGKLDDVGSAIGDGLGEPFQVRLTASIRSGKVEELETQLRASTITTGALAGTGWSQEEDDRG